MDCISLNNIYKNFGEKEVLKGLTFSAYKGEALGFLGRNGAGKTTALRILTGVTEANSGEILVDGKIIDRSRIKIGYLPEERGLYAKKKIFDQLCYFARLAGLNMRDAEKSVETLLERLGMTEYKNSKLETLSKGNQQKIQFVTAFAHDPDVIILDEPFSGLDPVNSVLLRDIVREQTERGKTVILSGHQMSYIEEMCDKAAILNDGKISVFGKISDIKHQMSGDMLLTIDSPEKEKILNKYPDRTHKAQNGEVIFELSAPSEKREVINMLSAEFELDGIKLYEPSMEDIFVKYTADKKEEANE